MLQFKNNLCNVIMTIFVAHTYKYNTQIKHKYLKNKIKERIYQEILVKLLIFIIIKQ